MLADDNPDAAGGVVAAGVFVDAADAGRAPARVAAPPRRAPAAAHALHQARTTVRTLHYHWLCCFGSRVAVAF